MLNYQADPQLLRGKVILVTGASAGIGKEAALTYARHGAHVVLLGRNTDKLNVLKSMVETQGGITPIQYPLDLLTANLGDYQQLAGFLSSKVQQLDGLLLNAGILGTLGPIEHSDPEQWHQVQHVNVTSSVLLIQALLPLLRRSLAAAILFTSSGVGRRGRANWGAYAVSKFATEGLMQVLADELSTTHIRVNAINPGATRTAMRAQARPDENPAALHTPADLMPLYLYLMGEDGRSVHGQSVDAQQPPNR